MESAVIHSSEVYEVDSGIPMTFFKGFSTSPSLLQGRALKKMPIFGKTNENAVSFYTCELFSDIQIPSSF